MPYLEPHIKENLDSIAVPTTPGELNYLITKLALKYLAYKGLNYLHVNDVVGALECAKQEFYRRVAVPYEDVKIQKNGDVY